MDDCIIGWLMDGHMDGRLYGLMVAWIDRGMDGCLHWDRAGSMVKCMDGCTNLCMNGCKDGCMEGRIDIRRNL